ncbi:MAG: pantetheine-phosphate adenylyltransferase [Anaerolineaceae bacterium]|nr:pantetheine-phosphate adenylyltransferase [Anaerolineaceae bacterium]MCY4010325.1 pantetheine-phosphate adenylyltransferase [Anaerolineaceae bacterium]
MSERLAVYPGTLDPLHYGHIDIIQRATRIFDRVIVAIYDQRRGQKEVLFSIAERMELAQSVLAGMSRVEVASFSGLVVEYAHRVGALALVRGLRVFSDFEYEFRMGLANKQLAPQLETVVIMSDEQHIHLSSSTIREIAELGGDVSRMVPPAVLTALCRKYPTVSRRNEG